MDTLEQLKEQAEGGATIIFQDQLPQDVPGFAELDYRREEFHSLISDLKFENRRPKVREARIGDGRFLVGDLESALELAEIPRETLVDHGELLFVRRKATSKIRYLICNHGTQSADAWITPAVKFSSALLMDPMTGRTGMAATRTNDQKQTQVYLQLPGGGSVILRTDPPAAPNSRPGPIGSRTASRSPWPEPGKSSSSQAGRRCPRRLKRRSWPPGPNLAARRRRLSPARPVIASPSTLRKAGKPFQLDLGRVCQSARVRLNGREMATLILAPYQVILEDLKPTGNVLEVDVTNVAANRIRDLDRRHVVWRKFNDINFASISYKPFDASNWPLSDSGLLGPVTLRPMRREQSSRHTACAVHVLVPEGHLKIAQRFIAGTGIPNLFAVP